MKLNWNWLKPTLANAPIPLIALPAAYGSAQFEMPVYPGVWGWCVGLGVESGYIALIFFARNKSKGAFWAVAISAMLVSMLYNTLNAANDAGIVDRPGSAIQWLLAFAHGAPLSLLALAFAVILHYSSDAKPNAQKDAIEVAPTVQIAHHYAPPAADSGGDAIEDATTTQPEPVSVQVVLDAVTEDALDPREIARQLRNDGGSWDEIATALGKSKRTVQLWVNGR